LSVRDGRRSTIRDVRRRALWRTIGGSDVPTDGGHVVLTIDAEIQRIAERAIAGVVEAFAAESAVAVVMEPRTGAIRAMACVPLFDPSAAGQTDPGIRRNRAVTDPVEPGSTFKPFILGGALAGGYVRPGQKFDCGMGTRRFGGRVLRDTRPHGDLTVAEIVIKSSNIGMGLIGERMQAEGLHRTLTAFGFGSTTGIGFPGESPGLVYPIKKWGKLSVTSIPMGYEVMVTPLQLASAMCTILNDGVTIRPRLIERLLAADGTPLDPPPLPEIVGRALPEEVCRYLRDEVLLPTVEEGTGGKARVAGYQLLGKTGTAKLVDSETHRYEQGQYLGSFVGAAPASDPRVVVLVMVRRPDASRAYYGGSVAAPAASVIFEETLAYLAVAPDKQGFASVALTRGPG
jgi:cell division protein FtsI/penicillin-binding protein 2